MALAFDACDGKSAGVLAFWMFLSVAASGGTTCTDGIASALPAGDGAAISIDGKLDDWDRSGAVLCWNVAELADRQNAAIYFMYDETNLYIAAEMALYDHEATNENRPQDRYWRGDLVQVRLSTDQSLPYPLPPRTDPRLKANPAVTCVNLWRNTRDGSDNLYVTPGVMFDCENVLRPSVSSRSSTLPCTVKFSRAYSRMPAAFAPSISQSANGSSTATRSITKSNPRLKKRWHTILPRMT